MTENSFKITFEILANDRVRVFLNDSSVGFLRIHSVLIDKKPTMRLTYRDTSSPFKNLIQTSKYTDFAVDSVESLLKDSHVYRRVVAAAIRSYLYNYATVEIPLHLAA